MDVLAGFDWDAGNWPKCGKHGVSRAEIEALFGRQPYVLPDRTQSDETRYNAIGETDSGRCVFIVFAIRQDRIRPISARFMHEKERRNYERQKNLKAVPNPPER
ncbi:BrnT family toxin [Aureimonas glaciei]|uniref:BrnT family toxin n=1 Tax=Aureimonas glaciei TaxID=1776957 RepID=A0A916Y7C8_9HYPH|nr:BrnT family toxin [Aureimonas glaciei]GGD32991.1 hypothetical protein GCM10011335_39990 [Aureimonas glaciei]